MNKKFWIVPGILLLGALYYFWPGKAVDSVRQEAIPVRAAVAGRQDVPRHILGLGTVTPLVSTVVQSRVDGYLVRLHFIEGQEVNKGDLLAEIDPRPFEIKLQQAEGALIRNEALLKSARLDFERYSKLQRERAVSQQQLQEQESLVGQFEGAVMTDKAIIEEARLQLAYSRIEAPVTGTLGLRSVDLGGMVRASDSAGLVRITRTRPTYVSFTVVEKFLPDIRKAMQEITASLPADAVHFDEELGVMPSYGLTVDVFDQSNKTILATGLLVSLDNQIDSGTGTVKAKAIFENSDNALYPNQFVNVRLLVATEKNAVTIPVSSIQRGNDGFFVYTVKNATSHTTPVEPGYTNNALAVITKGLDEGETVVTDGLDRLRDGTRVAVQK